MLAAVAYQGSGGSCTVQQLVRGRPQLRGRKGWDWGWGFEVSGSGGTLPAKVSGTTESSPSKVWGEAPTAKSFFYVFLCSQMTSLVVKNRVCTRLIFRVASHRDPMSSEPRFVEPREPRFLRHWRLAAAAGAHRSLVPSICTRRPALKWATW